MRFSLCSRCPEPALPPLTPFPFPPSFLPDACPLQYKTNCIHMCSAVDVMTPERVELLDSELSKATGWLSSALSVVPVEGNLQLPQLGKCLPANTTWLPYGMQREGVPNTDLLLLVSMQPMPSGMLSNSTLCGRDHWGRPIAAHIFLSPVLLPHSKKFEDRDLKLRLLNRVLLHEMTHVLGFDGKSLMLFRDENLNLRGSTTDRIFFQGEWMQGIATPAVASRAAEHFGAPGLGGFPLQLSNDSILTKGSFPSDIHWLTSAAVREIMAGSITVDSVYSDITLALLADSGWYRVNHSMAGWWPWGKGQGQQFAELHCAEWPAGPYNCREVGSQGCSYDHTAKGVCSQVSWTTLDAAWSLGSAAPFKCPVVQPTTGGSCLEMSSSEMLRSFDIEVLGPESRCFTGTTAAAPNSSAGFPLCLPHRCSDEGELSVLFGDQWYACPAEGGQLLPDSAASEAPIIARNISGSEAVAIELQCPVAGQVCPQPPACEDDCLGRGTCQAGKCLCYSGWSGSSCSEPSCPASCQKPRGTCVGGTCVCSQGWAGADCSSKQAEQCLTDCSDYGPAAVCINGHCENRCPSAGLAKCVNSSQAMPHLQLCGRYLGERMICSPDDFGELRILEAQRLGEYLKKLSPNQPGTFASSTAVCHESALELACSLAFPSCESEEADIVVPTCLSTCYSFHNDCNFYSGETQIWCSPGSIFRDDADERACSARRDTSWMQQSLQTLSIYALFLLGSCLLLYSTYRILRTWYVYSSYGGTTRGWCRWMFLSCCPCPPYNRGSIYQPDAAQAAQQQVAAQAAVAVPVSS